MSVAILATSVTMLVPVTVIPCTVSFTFMSGPTQYEDTALHLAVYNGHVDVATMLLEHGADVHAANQVMPYCWCSLSASCIV